MQDIEELTHIAQQIISRCNPQKILLFGSQARGTADSRSDFDICIVAETENKRDLLTDLYCSVDADRPIDFLLYTPSEWSQSVADKYSFAFKLSKEGVVLHARQ